MDRNPQQLTNRRIPQKRKTKVSGSKAKQKIMTSAVLYHKLSSVAACHLLPATKSDGWWTRPSFVFCLQTRCASRRSDVWRLGIKSKWSTFEAHRSLYSTRRSRWETIGSHLRSADETWASVLQTFWCHLLKTKKKQKRHFLGNKLKSCQVRCHWGRLSFKFPTWVSMLVPDESHDLHCLHH